MGIFWHCRSIYAVIQFPVSTAEMTEGNNVNALVVLRGRARQDKLTIVHAVCTAYHTVHWLLSHIGFVNDVMILSKKFASKITAVLYTVRVLYSYDKKKHTLLYDSTLYT
jgi:hypothetical protein